MQNREAAIKALTNYAKDQRDRHGLTPANALNRATHDVRVMVWAATQNNVPSEYRDNWTALGQVADECRRTTRTRVEVLTALF